GPAVGRSVGGGRPGAGGGAVREAAHRAAAAADAGQARGREAPRHRPQLALPQDRAVRHRRRGRAMMTEAEWGRGDNPWLMLDAIRGRVTDCRLWLFAIECCRRVSHLIEVPGNLTVIEVTAQRMEGLITEEEWQDAVIEADPQRADNLRGASPADRAAF